MVSLTRIYTGGGDGGETSLSDGARVWKDDARVDAYGDVDELNAVLGLARLHAAGEADAMLARIQNDLFDLGADLATPAADPAARPALRIALSQCDRLVGEIDAVNAALSPLTSFVLPGGSALSAHLHLARTVCRRAERRVVTLARGGAEIGLLPQLYLNRLSDLLFVLARAANDQGARDVLWRPGLTRGPEPDGARVDKGA